MISPKSILITGCSSGIGLALALEFKERGHTVFATARQAQALAKLTEMGLNAVELDVTNQISIDKAREKIQAQTSLRWPASANGCGGRQVSAWCPPWMSAMKRS
jgi:1-acylglycerone phosphate reductase